MGFTEKQEALVKESWEVVKQNIPEFSLRFFTLLPRQRRTCSHF
ncbi:hypothetical protein CsSME_00028115 [Camellia sinensis var. sinensis]